MQLQGVKTISRSALADYCCIALNASSTPKSESCGRKEKGGGKERTPVMYTVLSIYLDFDDLFRRREVQVSSWIVQ